MSNLHGFDMFFIALYFLILFGIAWWAARREKAVSSDYFLASRDVAWFAVGASLFASNIGSEHLVGLAGTGAGSGLAVGHFEWLACLILLLLGWLFVPYYLKSGVYTMPEFLEKRYNSAARSYFTWVSVIGYVLTKISVTLYAGGVVIRAVTGWNFYTAAIVLIVITGLYTIFGGLRAVVYTEVLQAIVLILGSIALMAIGLSRVGGIAGLEAKVPADSDQHIVQRVLAAKNIKQARTGTIFAGYLKILPVFIFVLPGIVAMALFSDVSNNPDSAYPTLVTRLLPDGIKGLVLAGMLAALMSSLASAFNACSTLLTWDVYKKMRPTASEQRLVTVGRISAGAMVFLGLAWIPLMKFVSSQIYIYLQSVQAYIAPPIAACFLLGLFFRRLNGTGAMASLVTGLVLGVLRLVLELTNKATGGLEAGTLWHWIATINFLHYAVLLFVICTAVLFVVSMMTPPPPADKIDGLTYVRAAPGAAAVLLEGETAKDRRFQIGLSVLLVAIIGVLWIVFA